MKLLLASFGVDIEYIPDDDGFSYDQNYAKDFFFRMPAVCMNAVGPHFVPDYSVFLLFDQFIIDARSLEAIRQRGTSSYFRAWVPLIEALESCGRLQVVDFATQLKPFRSMIRESVEYDLGQLDAWTSAFEKLASRWKVFADSGRKYFEQREKHHALGEEERRLYHIFRAWKMGMFPVRKDFLSAMHHWDSKLSSKVREHVRKIVRLYLEYVACNVVLSGLFDAAVYEWADLEPLFLKKARLALGAEPPIKKAMGKVIELFDTVVPQFEPKSPTSVIKALDDRRIESLRTLITGAAAKGIPFDGQFVNRTLLEVFHAERRLRATHQLVGWATTPLSLVPWIGGPLQKVADTAISAHLGSEFERKHGWLFLISDIADHT